MGFWENVDSELKYQGKSRKELAQAFGFDPTTISKGISNNSVPLADMALKIADYLDVSLEYLLGLPEKSKATDDKENLEKSQALHFYHKYHDLIEKCEELSSDKIKLLSDVAGNFERG
ncbi:MAG: helix-turn-helix transcriptional regulator [Treponema sp.]|nr:helix-turn-helix transcriptional regulator [Treponema sp.]